MGTHYCHLTEKDRILLRILLEKHYSKSKIADILKVHRSTVYREIKRNGWTHYLSKKRYYIGSRAQGYYLRRRQRPSRLACDKKLRAYVYAKLRSGWSPWQIEGRLKLENKGRCLISHETIYRHIYSDYGIHNRFYKKLRRRHFSRVKRGTRKPRVPEEMLIQHRPNVINGRNVFGHWECDLMMFKQGFKANLITLRERKTRFLLAIKNPNKTAEGTALRLISTLKSLKSSIFSITFDQGSEFQKYGWIKDCLKSSIYFCQPASPEQKGGIENANGVLRVEFPRYFNIDTLKQKEISRVVENINNRPLKCLGYRTPQESFLDHLQVTGKASYENFY